MSRFDWITFSVYCPGQAMSNGYFSECLDFYNWTSLSNNMDTKETDPSSPIREVSLLHRSKYDVIQITIIYISLYILSSWNNFVWVKKNYHKCAAKFKCFPFYDIIKYVYSLRTTLRNFSFHWGKANIFWPSWYVTKAWDNKSKVTLEPDRWANFRWEAFSYPHPPRTVFNYYDGILRKWGK